MIIHKSKRRSARVPRPRGAAFVGFLCLVVAVTAHLWGGAIAPPRAVAQTPVKITPGWSCSFAGDKIPSTVYTFGSEQKARDAVSSIMGHTGLVQNFDVRAADVDNAAAVIVEEGGQLKRLILYNQAFMLRVLGQTRTDWAATSIMAHEIGHHLQGHTLVSGGSRPDLELEADRYSGFVLQKMGATLEQAQAAMNNIASEAGSSSHPPKRSRLAAITNGWIAAKELKPGSPPPTGLPAPEPQQPDAPKLNEAWFVVMAKPRPAAQKYFTEAAASLISSADVVKYWKEGYRIVEVAGGDGRWWVVMDQKTGYGQQTYNVTDGLPTEWIKQRWAEDYYITNIANANGKWVVVMTKGVPYKEQSYWLTDKFPAEWIREKWNAQYRITEADCDGKNWVVVLSKNSGITMQAYTFDKTIPRDWIQTKWSEGYHLHCAAHNGTEWFVVMGQNLPDKEQAWILTDTLPAKWVKENWDEGRRITAIR